MKNNQMRTHTPYLLVVEEVVLGLQRPAVAEECQGSEGTQEHGRQHPEGHRHQRLHNLHHHPISRASGGPDNTRNILEIIYINADGLVGNGKERDTPLPSLFLNLFQCIFLSFCSLSNLLQNNL